MNQPATPGAWGTAPGPVAAAPPADPTPIATAAAAAAADDAGQGPAAPAEKYPADRTPGGLTRIPGREIQFGVPRAAVYGDTNPTQLVDVPAGFSAEDIARAWVQHLKLTLQDARGVIGLLPHGAVLKVLQEGGPLLAQLVDLGL